MLSRFTGAALGLLGFTIAVTAGLYAQNSPSVVLSRGIAALFAFCVMGLVLGAAAQAVLSEHERHEEMEIRKRYRGESAGSAGSGEEIGSTGGGSPSIGT